MFHIEGNKGKWKDQWPRRKEMLDFRFILFCHLYYHQTAKAVTWRKHYGSELFSNQNGNVEDPQSLPFSMPCLQDVKSLLLPFLHSFLSNKDQPSSSSLFQAYFLSISEKHTFKSFNCLFMHESFSVYISIWVWAAGWKKLPLGSHWKNNKGGKYF